MENLNVDNGADVTEANVSEAENIENVEQDAPIEDSNDEGNENDVSDDENNPKGNNEEWPSTAKTAVRNRDRKIAKLHAQMRELQAAQQQAQQQQPIDNGAPKEDDFEDYASFLKAQILHEIKSEKQGAEKQPNQSQLSVQEQMYIAQKEQLMTQKSTEYAKSIPDYQQVMQENAEILSYLPPEVQRVFFDADDAALATYNLAKSGRLADLIDMSPIQAAMAIAQAQAQPRMQPPPPPKHKTMQGAKGTAQVRSDDVLSGKELLNKYKVY